jgi:hypothetical protein
MHFSALPLRLFAAFLLCVTSFSSAETLVFPPYGHSYGIRKATPKHLFMFFGPRTFFDDPQGLATARMESRDDPSTESDDDEVVVYGVNSGRHQIIYNTTMWTLGLFGSKGSGTGEFRNPKGIACDPHGNVYVADAGNNRIVRLFNPRKKLRWVKAFSGRHATDRGLKNPSQVALDEEGRVYVTDTDNSRVVVFDSTGRALRYIPGEKSYSFESGPTTLAVADGRSRWSYFNGDRFMVCADRGGRRLWKIDFKGTVKDSTILPQPYRASYAAVDYYHNIWLTDKDSHCVIKLDRNLKLLDVVGTHGKGDYQFDQPRGIAIWKRYGQTFVAEKKGAQYYWIGTELAEHTLRPVDEKRYSLSTNLTEYSYATLFRVEGNDTLRLLKKKMIYPGQQETIFSCTAPCEGEYVLRIEPTYSSYTYYRWDFPLRLGAR